MEVPPGAMLPKMPGLVDMSLGERMAILTTDRYGDAVKAQLEQAGARLHEVQRMTLEEIFVANVMRSRQEAA